MTQEIHRVKRKQERITAEFNLPGAQEAGQTRRAISMPVITVLAYGPDGFVEKQVKELSELISYFANWPVTWVNVDPVEQGPDARLVIEHFAKIFSLHELEIEDIVNVHQRAKVEEYGEHLFIVTRMLINREVGETEQLSMFLGKNYVLTFREVPTDCLDPVREKIRKGRGRIRNEKADYLMYAIIDAVVDGYFPLLTELAERLDEIEDEILEGSEKEKEAPAHMYEIRRDLLSIRRAIWPTREALSSLTRDTYALVGETTRVYLRDCYDHAVRIIDLVEMYREVGSALMEVHYTRASNRLNEVMKVLTVITTLFIPPTFIAGIYGMNFNPEKSPFNMPELNWYFGYPLALLTMVVVSSGLLAYLYLNGWLGDRKGHR
ncbi:MAG TPA: magnesium/cobalt transporter CorA [Candidatus Obscuribacterales bacterium]